jgi:hypothetical protein
MSKEGFVYEPVSPPKVASPGFVYPAVTAADFTRLENEGYGLVTSIETALHHEATDSNTKMFQKLEASARIAFETAQRTCINNSVLPPDTGSKLLGKIAELRNQWLSDPALVGEWQSWKSCMQRAGIRVTRRDESMLTWAREDLQQEAETQSVPLEPPNESTLTFVRQYEKNLAKHDQTCLTSSGLPKLQQKWSDLSDGQAID